MNLTILYLQNSPLISLVYLVMVILLTFATYMIVRNLHALSGHRGIRFFGLAFLLFSIAFSIQLIGELLVYFSLDPPYFITVFLVMLFAYMITLSSFHLVYSLVWKQVETGPKNLVRFKIVVLYLIPLLTAVMGVVFFQSSKHFLFIPPIAVIGYGMFLSYQNYRDASEKTQRFRQLFFIVMALWFLGWVMNYISSLVIQYYPLFPMYAQAVTLSVFAICLYGVFTVTRKRH
ncbi:hypothetical protein ACFL3V_04085 [Nanoarchaeota archaeon]